MGGSLELTIANERKGDNVIVPKTAGQKPEDLNLVLTQSFNNLRFWPSHLTSSVKWDNKTLRKYPKICFGESREPQERNFIQSGDPEKWI